MKRDLLQKLQEEVSNESFNLQPYKELDGFEELEAINYTVEAAADEISKGIGLYGAITDIVEEHENGNVSFESALSLEHRLDMVLMASGLDIPKDLFYSTEAVDKAGSPNESKDIKEEENKNNSQSEQKSETKSEEKSGDKKESKKFDTSKAKDTLKKVWEWLVNKAKEFAKWVGERVKKVRELVSRVGKEADENEAILKGA